MVGEMIGLMRVKNEARWIRRCVESMFPLCDRVLVMDDHSTDGTPDICAAIPGVTVLPSPFEGLNETRDKNWLLENVEQGEWVLMIDGDEMLAPGAADAIRAGMAVGETSLALPILYLWDREDQVRTDGVYGRFWRPSAFRFTGHQFQTTAAGGNFHCGNVPLAQQATCRKIAGAPLLHFGYMHREDRVRKYAWYNAQDPNNYAEDRYRHMVQGDIPEIPADARLMHAGPLALRSTLEAAA